MFSYKNISKHLFLVFVNARSNVFVNARSNFKVVLVATLGIQKKKKKKTEICSRVDKDNLGFIILLLSSLAQN